MGNFIYIGIAVVIALTLHEFAHGYVSYKLGDPTPRTQGRLTLNPLAHLDIMGTIALFAFGFGWAKPVAVNPEYYRNPKQGMMLTAIAGPAMNFVIALISAVVLKIGLMPELLSTIMVINIGLGVFNLIPFPPLDGSKLLAGVLPERLYMKWLQYEMYGAVVLMGLLILGVLDKPLMAAVKIVTTIIVTIVGL